ncbi:MAG: ABC transporter ATP-binding protein [Archaeoglobaceae archaeon]|nr:ABC transporter ATP-binding protein [Archaeoglobaceae archaeon]MCX8152514.1 ABC transporter ATP-binding protein [Archaeoglobaceae archaeon]MDW8013608.1 ABC transporter ATP-binding protein [Archaeoglobaceae archaeon]
MMTVEDLEVWYGKILAVSKIFLKIEKGEIVGLIGPNGAGKSTILNSIVGVVQPVRGDIKLNGESILKLPTYERIKRGLAISPEGRKVFPYLTVEENLLMGAILGDTWKRRKDKLEQIYSLFPILKERKNQFAGTLSGGEQQMLTIARALMSSPRILLVDEPSLGLGPKIALEVYRFLKRLREVEKITILLADQNARRVLEISDRAYIIENGRIALEGSSEELLKNDNVRRVYLGL